ARDVERSQVALGQGAVGAEPIHAHEGEQLTLVTQQVVAQRVAGMPLASCPRVALAQAVGDLLQTLDEGGPLWRRQGDGCPQGPLGIAILPILAPAGLVYVCHGAGPGAG